MQVWAGDTAGGADKAHNLRLAHLIPFPDVETREMRQRREHAETVVDDDGVAGEIEIARADHAPGIRRLDRRAARAQKVGAAVRTARFAVEDAAGAE